MNIFKPDSRPRRMLPPPILSLGCLALTFGCVMAAAQVHVAVSTPKEPQARALPSEEAPVTSPSSPIEGPLLGFVVEPGGQSLRPILGIPGASHQGEVMDLGLKLAAASSRQRYVLGVDPSSEEVRLVDLRAGLAAGRSITGVDAGPNRIVISPRGVSAALYNRKTGEVQLVSGLPKESEVTGRVSVRGLPGVLTALAVDDAGRLLLAAFSQGDAGSLYLLSPQEDPRRIAAVGRVTSVAFLEGSEDALAADYGRNEIVLFRNVSQGVSAFVLASEQEGIHGPVAVAAAADGRRAFAATAGSGSVALLPLEGGAPALLSCRCRPTGLEPLGGDVFRLTEASAGPLFLLDAAQQSPRIVFVPPSEPSGPAAGDPQTPARAHRGRAER